MSEEEAHEPRVVEREAQAYVGIRGEVTDGVPALIDAIFPQLFGRIGELGLTPSGPPIVRVWEVDDANEPLVMEAGIPVASALPDGEEMLQAGEMPAGSYAAFTHVGPYRSDSETDMDDARAGLLAYIEAEGLAIGEPSERGSRPACAVDVLLRGPESTDDHSTWRTELLFLTS